MSNTYVRGNKVLFKTDPELGVCVVQKILDKEQMIEVQLTSGQLVIVTPVELIHYFYNKGDEVFIGNRKEAGVILEVRPSPGSLTRYDVFTGSGKRRTVLETDIEDTIEVNLIGRIAKSSFDFPQDFDLKTRATALSLAYAYDPFVSLSNSRLDPKPHQIGVAHRVVNTSLYPRMLLADEVGLGKTIEAGMVIKEMRARGLLKKCLIIVPANLVTQWQHELSSKFNEHFVIYDASKVKELERAHPAKNVWSLARSIISSFHFTRNEQRAAEIAALDWDLVVFDEAHHLRRYLESSGPRSTLGYRLASEINPKTQGMLLLTATPLQLNRFELFSLIELLNPALFQDYSEFYYYCNIIPLLNKVVSDIENFNDLPNFQKKQLWENIKQLPAFSQNRIKAGSLNDLAKDSSLRKQATEELYMDHRLTEIIIRNRKRIIGGFTERKAETKIVYLTPNEDEIYTDIQNYVRGAYQDALRVNNKALSFVMLIFQKLLTSSSHALASAILKRINVLKSCAANLSVYVDFEEDGQVEDLELSEEYISLYNMNIDNDEISRLEEFYYRVSNIGIDSKLRVVMDLLKSVFQGNSNEKVIIFTQFLKTVEYLEKYLSGDYEVVRFYGGLSREDKDAVIKKFKESAQIMICTEAGGEGRNLQFCNILFNYDLPWNPMRIEQRIGRLDRIGQKKPVEIYNFTISGTIEDRIFSVLNDRIKLFEETIGGLDPILGNVENDIKRIVFDSNNVSENIEKLAGYLEKKIKEAKEADEKMADFIMDSKSFNKYTINRLLNRKPGYTGRDLEEFIKEFLSRYEAITFKKRQHEIWKLEMPPAFKQRVKDRIYDTYEGTFDLPTAMHNEDVDFFAFGHELIDAVIGYCSSDDFPGLTTCRTVTLPGRGNTAGIQFNYILEYTGVQVYRKIVPVFIDFDFKYDQELSQEIFKAPSVNKNPAFTLSLDKIHLLKSMEQKSIDILSNLAEEELSQRIEISNEQYCREKEKTEKLYNYRINAAGRRHERLKNLYLEQINSKDSNQRKIAPATKGRLDRVQREMNMHRLELNERLSFLETNRDVSYSFSLLNLALVEINA